MYVTDKSRVLKLARAAMCTSFRRIFKSCHVLSDAYLCRSLPLAQKLILQHRKTILEQLMLRIALLRAGLCKRSIESKHMFRQEMDAYSM